MLDILNSGVKVDGVWTSGIDYTVVNAFKTAGKPLVPVVGADNNEFLQQLLAYEGFRGAAVTNPATIGGAGAASRSSCCRARGPELGQADPQVWDNGRRGKSEIKANYSPSRPPTYSARLQIKPWTTYTTSSSSLQGAVDRLTREGRSRPPPARLRDDRPSTPRSARLAKSYGPVVRCARPTSSSSRARCTRCSARTAPARARSSSS
jgi:hypothetical protein